MMLRNKDILISILNYIKIVQTLRKKWLDYKSKLKLTIDTNCIEFVLVRQEDNIE